MVEMDKTHQEIITKHYEKQQDIRNDYEMRLSRQQNSYFKKVKMVNVWCMKN